MHVAFVGAGVPEKAVRFLRLELDVKLFLVSIDVVRGEISVVVQHPRTSVEDEHTLIVHERRERRHDPGSLGGGGALVPRDPWGDSRGSRGSCWRMYDIWKA